jgi:glycosyl transferase family 25
MTTPLPTVYIITLPGARRTAMQRQLDALNTVKYEFFDGVHGREQPDHYLFQKYDARRRAAVKGKSNPLKLSQLGCFASHYLLWERCIHNNAPIIVLEDDAVVLPCFADFYARAMTLAGKHGLIWLNESTKAPRQKDLVLEQSGPFKIKKRMGVHTGAVGYLLTPSSARALVEYCSTWVYPVDDSMARFYDHKVESIVMEPACVAHNDAFESTINDAASKPKRTIADRLARESSNLKDAIKRSLHNARFYVGRKWGEPARRLHS